MIGVRALRYAARDRFAGAIEMNEKIDYIRRKEIKISNEDKGLEVFQIVLQSSYKYKRKHNRLEVILDTWRAYCKVELNYIKKIILI